MMDTLVCCQKKPGSIYGKFIENSLSSFFKIIEDVWTRVFLYKIIVRYSMIEVKCSFYFLFYVINLSTVFRPSRKQHIYITSSVCIEYFTEQKKIIFYRKSVPKTAQIFTKFYCVFLLH